MKKTEIVWRSDGTRRHAINPNATRRGAWVTLCGRYAGYMKDGDGTKCRLCLARMTAYGFVEKEIDNQAEK